MGVDTDILGETRTMSVAGGPDVYMALDPALQTLLDELSTREVMAVQSGLAEEPDNYDDWVDDLTKPSQFLTNMIEAEALVRELKRVKKKLLDTNDDLDKALLRLRLPFLDVEEEEQILKSAEWPEMRELLFLFELRFIPRIPGIVYLLQRANDYLYQEKPFVGMEECYGFVDIIDAKGFTHQTIVEGAESSSRSLAVGLYSPTFDALERAEGELLVQTAGDALVPVRKTDSLADSRASHLRFMANVARGLKVPCHITIGSGHYGIVITPGGKLVVLGEAFDRAEAGQEMSKAALNELNNLIMIVYEEDGEIEYLNVDDYSGEMPLPERSAIHFFRGMNEDEFKRDFASNPKALLAGMRRQMALMAAPMSREALQSKETVERSAISLYVQAPIESDGPDKYHNELLQWERKLEAIGKKYNAKVRFFTLNGGKKSGILIFGAQGSSQINKEERSARCANELLELEPEAQIGLKEGAIHISNMGEGDISGAQEVISNAVNGSQRLAACYLGDGKIARIRLDKATYELFKQRGLILSEEESQEIDLKSYGETVVWLGGEFKIERASSYVREDKVCEIVDLVSQATDDRKCDLVGEFGAGQIPVLYEAARRLQSEHGMQIVILPEYHDRRSYAGFRQVLDSVFANADEFTAWLNKIQISSGQGEFWKMLFDELHGPSENVFLLGHPDYAKPELISLLKALGEDFGVACSHWEQMDRVSREILLDSNVVLLAIGCAEAERKIDFMGVSLVEALKIVAFYLDIDVNILHGSDLSRELIRLASNSGRYNPMVVEVLIKDWIEKRVVTVGSPEFEGEKIKRKARVTRLENMVTHYADQLTTASGRTLFSIALALGNFSVDQLYFAATPPIDDLQAAISELQRVGIFQPGEVGFSQPYFVVAGRNIQELKPEVRHARQVERNLRAALEEQGFFFDQYLGACGNMGVAWCRPVISKVLDQMEECFESQDLLGAMDCGQQFMELGTVADVGRFEVQDFERVLRINHYLIEAKIILGEGAEQDLLKVKRIMGAIPDRMKQFLFTDMARFFDLQAEARYKSNQDLEAHALAVDELVHHYKVGVAPNHPSFAAALIHLHKAKLAYRQADSSKNRLERLAYIDEAIRILSKNMLPLFIEPFDSDVKRLLMQAQGYRLLDLGEVEGPDELRTYINDVECFLGNQPVNVSGQQREANLQLGLFLARAYMAPPNAPIDIEAGEVVARRIIGEASENHFRDAGLKGYNYLINVPEIKGAGLLREGRYREAYNEFGRMEAMWEEMKLLAKPLGDQENVAQTLLASQLTWAFGLVEQCNCLRNLGESEASVLHKLRNLWSEIQDFQNQHPRAWIKYSAYIRHLRSFVEANLS